MTEGGDELRDGARALVGLDALAEMAESLALVGDISADARGVLHRILGTLVCSRGALYLFEPDASMLVHVAGRGVDPAPLPVPRPQAVALSRRRDPARGAELELVGLGSEDLVALLGLRGQLLGLVRLGAKFMGQPWSQGDLDLLKVIALNLSVSLFSQSLLRRARETSLQLRRKVLEMETLREVGLEISALRDLPSLCREILERAVALIAPRAGLLLLYSEAARSFVSTSHFGIEALPGALAEESELCRSFLDAPGPVTVAEGDGGATLGARKSVLATAIRSKDRVLGALVLCDKEGRTGIEDWSDEDGSLLEGFAAQAAIAIDNARMHEAGLEQERMQKELQLAAGIQQNLLPQAMPRVTGYEVAALTRPCRTVGGDYYDFLALPDGRWLIIVADVAGKGIPAALLVFTLSATLYALLPELVAGRSLPEFVAAVNHAVHRSSTSSRFITCFFAILDPVRGTLTTVNAGHNPPLLLRAVDPGGAFPDLKSGGLCLGMFDPASYQQEVTEIGPGDVLTLYSDGVTEAQDRDDEELGMERLEASIRAARGRDAAAVIASVTDAVARFVGPAPQFDDLTVVVLRRLQRS